MRAASLAVAMVALFQLARPVEVRADVELDALRVRAADATSTARDADEALAASLATRDREERALRRLEAEGEGFFASRRIRQQSAVVRGAVEVSLALAEQARIAGEERKSASAALRDELFLAASAATRTGDDAARAARASEAQEHYRVAASLLAEASRVGAGEADPGDETDPFAGLDLAIPITGTEGARELAAISEAYRRAAEETAARSAAIAPRLAAAQAAVEAWDRLSRFRGVLERAGGVTADPRPARDRLATQAERGRLVESVLRRRAAEIDAQRVGSREVSP